MAIKNNDKVRNVAMLFVSALLGAAGQLMYKFGFGAGAYLVVWIAAGLFAYTVGTILYFIALSRSHLSWAYGITGLSYVFATIFAATILVEQVPLLRWIGVTIIFIGVALIGMS